MNIDNSKGYEVKAQHEMEVDLNEITDENLVKVTNKLLAGMGGRRRVISVIDKRIGMTSKIFFLTKNGFGLVVFIERDRVKFIIQQTDKDKPYTFLGNGQAGQNSRQVYNYLVGEGKYNEFYLSNYV